MGEVNCPSNYMNCNSAIGIRQIALLDCLALRSAISTCFGTPVTRKWLTWLGQKMVVDRETNDWLVTSYDMTDGGGLWRRFTGLPPTSSLAPSWHWQNMKIFFWTENFMIRNSCPLGKSPSWKISLLRHGDSPTGLALKRCPERCLHGSFCISLDAWSKHGPMYLNFHGPTESSNDVK